MTKRIFILNGHPADTSLNKALARAYAVAAKAAGNHVRTQNISEMDFDIDYGFGGFANHKPLEPALETMMQNIEWCEHLVLVTPMWWGGIPAKLKGALDRSFLPGRAFDSRVPPGKMPLPMLSGRQRAGYPYLRYAALVPIIDVSQRDRPPTAKTGPNVCRHHPDTFHLLVRCQPPQDRAGQPLAHPDRRIGAPQRPNTIPNENSRTHLGTAIL